VLAVVAADRHDLPLAAELLHEADRLRAIAAVATPPFLRDEVAGAREAVIGAATARPGS
jgi:hypothetical protein